jgi:hypothetical protein
MPMPGSHFVRIDEEIRRVRDWARHGLVEHGDLLADMPSCRAGTAVAMAGLVDERRLAARHDRLLRLDSGRHVGQRAFVASTCRSIGSQRLLTTARALIAVITTLNEQAKVLQGQVEAHFGQHPAAEIYLSQPGIGAVLGARVPGEFGDDPHRYADAKARRNYAATSPITRASGKKKIVAARFIHNDRLVDAYMAWAFSSLKASPGTRAFYDALRARGIEHNDVPGRAGAAGQGAGPDPGRETDPRPDHRRAQARPPPRRRR